MNLYRLATLAVDLSYLPPEPHATEAGFPAARDEEWTVLRALPECPTDRIHEEELCDACWFLEHISVHGLDQITGSLEWEGRGREAATIAAWCRLTSERVDTRKGHHCATSLAVISRSVLPPEPDRVDVGLEAAK